LTGTRKRGVRVSTAQTQIQLAYHTALQEMARENSALMTQQKHAPKKCLMAAKMIYILQMDLQITWIRTMIMIGQ
jgi:hypothetical protein